MFPFSPSCSVHKETVGQGGDTVPLAQQVTNRTYFGDKSKCENVDSGFNLLRVSTDYSKIRKVIFDIQYSEVLDG